MPSGYMDDDFSGSPSHSRRRRIGSSSQRSQRMHRASSGADGLYPPPPPPPPPPGTRRRYSDPPRDNRWERERQPRRNYDDDYYDPPPRRVQRSYARPPPPPPPPPRRPPPREYRENYRDDDYGERPQHAHKKDPPQHDSSGSGASRAAVVIVVLILILLVLYMFRGPIMDFINDPPPLRYQEYPEGIDFSVTKDMELSASGGPQDSISYTVKSALPKDYVMGSFYLQDVQSTNTNPTPTTSVFEGNQEIMLWQKDNFLGTDGIQATYTIRTRFYQWELDEESSGNIADIPQGLKDRYNHDEWKIDDDRDGVLDSIDDIDKDGNWDYLIEPSNPDIQNLASDLSKGETKVYKVIKSFYDFLTLKENLNYIPGREGLPKDCISTLNQLRGDCDDYSILMISLCRSVDIPAWLELGVLYDKTQRTWGGHGWVKVAIPFDGGWTAATIDVVNKQFLFHDPYRFIEWIDTGGDITVIEEGETKVYNNLDYYYHSFSYRSYGSPHIVSPDTNNFITNSISEFGDTKKIPVEGDGGSELCMIPGFDGVSVLVSIMALTLIIMVVKPIRFR